MVSFVKLEDKFNFRIKKNIKYKEKILIVFKSSVHFALDILPYLGKNRIFLDKLSNQKKRKFDKIGFSSFF